MSNQIVITSGAKVRSLEGVITGSAGVLGSVPLGAAGGVATLDSGGKVPVSQLPSSVVTYLGTWNAATNTPTLVNGVGDAGDMYICNVAGTVNFGAGPVTFAVGDWVLYGSGTWQKSNGQNGTVTSVGASITGNAIGLTGSPITTAGTLAFAFSGTSGQYVNGAGNLTTFPTLITSIGLSMPSAFSVANSPLTANGSINVTGAGTSAQYIDGTGALQTFPALTGYVPYTGATTDVDLGTHVLNAQALHVKGTAGAGHLGLKHQTASPTGSANESLIFADVNGNLGWQNDNLYLTTLVSNANTANRSYTFPNASGTLALTSDISYPVTSVFGRTGAVTAQSGDYTTTLVTEGTNLYYTDARARAALSFTAGSGAYNSTTGVITIPTNNNQITNGAGYITLTSLSAGTGISYNNLTGVISSTITQYTDAMARAAISGGTGISYNSTTGVITNTITQYTDALARASISLTTTGTSGAATYNSTTGVLNIPQYTDAYTGTVTSVAMTVPTGLSVSGSPITTSGTLAVTLTAGYSIPTTASQTNWDTAYTNRITSATSPLSITSNVISISQATTSTSGYLSSTDWNTFNSKQGTITLTTTGSSGAATLVSNTLNIPNYTLSGLGGIGGSGTANYLPKFTAGTTIGNSIIYESTGGNIGIGETNPASYKLQVKGADGSGIQYEDTNAVKTLMGSYSNESIIGSLSNHSVGFWSNNTKKMTLNTSGNLGLGVTPSAWNTVQPVFQIGYTAFSAYQNTQAIYSSNGVYTSGWKYLSNTNATYYSQNEAGPGIHAWFIAPSGTAGSAISFTQAMTLTANGNLLINTATDSGYKLDVNGTARVSGDLTIGTGSQIYLTSGDLRFSSNAGYGIVSQNGTRLVSIQNGAFGVAGAATFSSNIIFANNNTGINYGSSRFFLYNGTNTYIGDIDALSSTASLIFRTNGVDRLTILATGAATFSSSVTTGGTITLNAPSANYATLNLNGAAGYGAELKFGEATGGYLAAIRHNYNVGTGLEFYTGGTGAGSLRMYIAPSGNIGIGTSSPSGALTVAGANGAGISIDQGNYNYYGAYTHIFKSSSYTTEFMRISNTGNVLIGTTTDAGYKLDVNGTGRFSGAAYFNAQTTSTYSTANLFSIDPALRFKVNGGTANRSIYDLRAIAAGGGYDYLQIRLWNDALTTPTELFKLDYTGAATFSSTIKTAGFGSTTAQPWKLGQLVTATVIGVNTTGYLTVEVNGSQYNLALANLA